MIGSMRLCSDTAAVRPSRRARGVTIARCGLSGSIGSEDAISSGMLADSTHLLPSFVRKIGFTTSVHNASNLGRIARLGLLRQRDFFMTDTAAPNTRAKLNFSTDWSYAPAPESASHVKLLPKYDLFINGKFTAPAKGKYFETINPATEKKLAEVAEATSEDVDAAVKAARKAYNNVWSKMPAKERGKYIYRIARMIQDRARELAVIESMDGGKAIRESRDVDVPLAAAHFFYYAGWADKLEYAFPGKQPTGLGVAGQVIPWNFPLLMAAWKLAPALACGCTVVLKPAETTPLTALKLAELIADADLPPGVVNILTGAGETGAAIVNHPDIDKVAFTGSTDVGKIIQKSLAGTKKKYTLELGGKAANIVFEDAAIDQAVEGIINGIFFNQGHVCCAGSRLFVQESVYDTVIQKLQDRMQTLIVGDPMDKNTDIGAINSKAQLDKINHYLKIGGEDEGAEMWCDRRLRSAGLRIFL